MAIAFLFRPYNDIDVYVEDTVARNLYEVLIERVLAGRARVTRVIQLGPRNAVVSACAADQLPSGRRRLYLIDGDLDLLAGVAPPSLKHLHRLQVYASENLVFSRESIREVAYECMPNMDRQQLDATLTLDTALKQMAAVLVPLFVIYGAAWMLDKSVATSGVNVLNLCTHDKKFPRLDEAKVTDRILEVRNQLSVNHSGDELARAIAAIEKRIGDPVTALVRFVSGKTYLLPLLFHYLKERVKYSGTIEQLKVRLARHASLTMDEGLTDAILEASRGVAA